ncbi:putative beta lactamase [Azoarcus olearius]|uniref:quinoprotein relay system zinc metallohydrolase 1 n=1 Tax=Azoarcus sp. (strain BH72) TaxID=418699 RepID=UPI0008060AE9|nr:quinoprotein relay system zinc metallohydrolase 1 [Azoarcus olearius]ANQ86140.1 putative beta lactamase [Azoarcus olearius]
MSGLASLRRAVVGATVVIAAGAGAGYALQAVAEAPQRSVSFDYRLQPQRVADGVYALIGRREDFSFANGGNVVNTGFIVGKDGVVVIDTGVSKRYGEQLRAAIARVTPLPVVLVINTHHHPDHFLGNQAFAPATLAALPATSTGIATEGGAFTDNMYRLNGDWMRDTEPVAPQRALAPGRLAVAGRELELIAADGHTGADLAVLDVGSGVLFAGDLVFHDRAPTTPHADIPAWLSALDRLERLDFRVLVPGHGDTAADAGPIRQTRDYLRWLQAAIREGAENGLDMTEMLGRPLPARFRTIALAETEYRRSVAHLFPRAEQAALETQGRR